MLDEVDLILHPLKSELNWPMGARVPLDLTVTNGVAHGLRWQVRSWDRVTVYEHEIV